MSDNTEGTVLDNVDFAIFNNLCIVRFFDGRFELAVLDGASTVSQDELKQLTERNKRQIV